MEIKKNSQCDNIKDKVEPSDLFTTVHQFEKFNMNTNKFNFEVKNKIPVNKILVDFGIGVLSVVVLLRMGRRYSKLLKT